MPDEAVSINGFNHVRKDRERGNGGGIICFFKPTMVPIVITSREVPLLANCKTEFLPLYFRCASLLVIACYHPFWDNAVEHEAAIECITSIIDYFVVNSSSNSFLRVSVLGDFNDLTNYYSHLSDVTQLNPVVTFPTRGTRILDQIFSNFCDKYYSPVKLAPVGRSDHCSILWRPVHHLPSVRKVRIRKMSKSARAGFLSAVNSVDWLSTSILQNSLNDSFLILHDTILYLLDLFFPFKTIRVRSDEPPWMTVSLKVLINDRDRAFANNQLSKFLRIRAEVIDHIKYLQSTYLHKAAVSGDARKLWSAINSLGRRHKRGTGSANFSCEAFSSFFGSNFQIDHCPCMPSLDELPRLSLCVTVPEVEFYLSEH
jgi:hypothetical protein